MASIRQKAHCPLVDTLWRPLVAAGDLSALAATGRLNQRHRRHRTYLMPVYRSCGFSRISNGHLLELCVPPSLSFPGEAGDTMELPTPRADGVVVILRGCDDAREKLMGPTKFRQRFRQID